MRGAGGVWEEFRETDFRPDWEGDLEVGGVEFGAAARGACGLGFREDVREEGCEILGVAG